MASKFDYCDLFDGVFAVTCTEENFLVDPQRFELLDFHLVPHDSPFDHYFGPPNLGFVCRFCQKLSAQRIARTKSILAVLSSDNPAWLTNKVFLLGAYMILQLGSDVPSVIRILEPFTPLLVPYCNSPVGSASFDLHVQDCLWALFRAREVGWSDIGCFDVDEYEELNSSLNADLNQVSRQPSYPYADFD